MKSLFEVMPAEMGESATRWSCPSLNAESAHGQKKSSRNKLNTADHLDEIEKTAYEEGFARGRADGYKEGIRETQAMSVRMNLLMEHLSRPLKDLSIEVEHALVRLVVDAARRLVNEAIQLDPKIVSGAVHEAVAAVATTTREMKIFLHPDDAAVLKDTLTFASDTTWKLLPDAALSRGDCRVVTESSQIDARMDTRQLNIERALLGEDA